MDCQEIKKYLYPFMDAELNRKRSLEVQAHLDSCPLCSLEFESEKKIESVINEKSPRDKAPLALREKVIKQIELAEARSSFWRTFHSFLPTKPKHAFAILTILAMVVSLFIIYYRTARAPYLPVFEEAVTDHTNFLAGRLPLEILSSQPDEVFSWFEGKLDFSVRVPRFPGEEIKLLGGDSAT
jgi:mycothiol system anti-sigma-R factor